MIDTALTLNAMHPDLLVVRHPHSGAVDLLAQKVNCAVLNAGDGKHEHPTQALLDALTIRRAKGRLHRLSIAICGDVAHSRVARSNIMLLGKMENRISLIAPPTLMPSGIGEFGVEVFEDMEEGLKDVDVVMMLRLQKERMDGGFIPSEREYYPPLRPERRKTCPCQTRRDCHAPRPDEPRGGNRRHDCRRHQPVGHSRTGGNGRRRAHGRNGPAGAKPARISQGGDGMTVIVPANDHGTIYVFEVSGTPPTDLPAKSDSALIAVFGPVVLNTDYVDVIGPDTLTEMTLPQLLENGYDMPVPDDLSTDLRKIDGITILVMSAAFGGQELELDLPQNVRLVACLREKAAMNVVPPLISDAASGTLDDKPAKKPKSAARMSGMVATYALLAMFLLVGLMIWVGG